MKYSKLLTQIGKIMATDITTMDEHMHRFIRKLQSYLRSLQPARRKELSVWK